MIRKYEFTGNTRGSLKRIRRISDGALGGWIESECNLSHEGQCWVSDNALVFGDAWVSDNAEVSRNAQVSGDAWVFGNAQVSGDARVAGNAWVFGDAQVAGDAWVAGNAQVFGDAQVAGNARITSVVKMVSRSDRYTFTVFPCADGVWRLTAGCWFFTMDEAWKHWETTRAGTDLGEETFDILVMFEHHIERETRKQKG